MNFSIKLKMYGEALSNAHKLSTYKKNSIA